MRYLFVISVVIYIVIMQWSFGGAFYHDSTPIQAANAVPVAVSALVVYASFMVMWRKRK